MSVHLPPIDKKKKKKSRSKSKSKSRKHKDETVNTTTIIKTLNEFNVSRVEKDNDTTTLENKAKLGVHAFVVDKNIHDNYSAYRLNNNMGIGGGHGPSKKRMGFNGQFVDMDEYNYMKYNGMLNQDLSQSHQVDGSYIDGFQANTMQAQSSQQQYSYPTYNPSTNYNQFYYENVQNPSVSQSIPYFSQPMYNAYPQQQYNVHNRYNSYTSSPGFYGNNYQQPYSYQSRVPMLNFNSPSYQGNMGAFPDLSTGRIPRTQQLPSISQSNPRMTRYASASRANFGFNQPPVNETWDNSRQRSLGRNYQMKNPSMF